MISCDSNNKEIKYSYYKNGKIESMIDCDSILTIFFENGQIKETGKIMNGHKINLWKEFYPDGSIKWEGVFLDTNNKIGINDSSISISIKDLNDSILKLNNAYYLRIKSGFHPSMISCYFTQGSLMVSEDENYDYKFYPRNEGSGKLRIRAMTDDKKIKIKEFDFKIIK